MESLISQRPLEHSPFNYLVVDGQDFLSLDHPSVHCSSAVLRGHQKKKVGDDTEVEASNGKIQ